MLRVFVIAFTLALSFDLSGLAAICGEPPCDDCSQDRPGQCAPNCDSCACCSFPKMARADATGDLIRPELVKADWPSTVEALPSAESADILHVPKRLLA